MRSTVETLEIWRVPSEIWSMAHSTHLAKGYLPLCAMSPKEQMTEIVWRVIWDAWLEIWDVWQAIWGAWLVAWAEPLGKPQPRWQAVWRRWQMTWAHVSARIWQQVRDFLFMTRARQRHPVSWWWRSVIPSWVLVFSFQPWWHSHLALPDPISWHRWSYSLPWQSAVRHWGSVAPTGLKCSAVFQNIPIVWRKMLTYPWRNWQKRLANP